MLILYYNYNIKQSNLAIDSITPNLPCPWGTATIEIKATCLIQCYLVSHSVPAKWHLIPSNDFSRVQECDRRQTHMETDGQTML